MPERPRPPAPSSRACRSCSLGAGAAIVAIGPEMDN